MPKPEPNPDPYHYRVIARAITLCDAAQARGAPLSLSELAAELGLSPAHFQRVFSRWAGVSPKSYQQYLTLEAARALLRQDLPLARTAGELGLSGTGRLHDLVLRWEAMTPLQTARRGAGLRMAWGRFDSPFGPMLAMGTPRGLSALAFCATCGEAAALADLHARWPEATLVHDPDPLAPWVAAALAGRGEARLHLWGGPFQIKVWEALMRIPPGAVTTYSALAEAIGSPRAVRAVGTAVGRNPLAWLIPCHRVLRRDGGLGGYHWGLPVKRALLAHEAVGAAHASVGMAKPQATAMMGQTSEDPS